MKKGWLLYLLAAVLLTGCGASQSPRFYSLRPLASPAALPAGAEAGNAALIGLGPVAVPDRLDRPQILSISGDNEVTVAEFDRWPGSLREEISRTVAENLTLLLPSYRVVSFPWGRRLNPDRQIAIDIIRMDGQLGGQVLLKANWAVTVTTDSGAKTVLVRHMEIAEEMSGSDYTAYVAAQSRALEKLSREIAAAVTSPPK